MTLTGSPDGNQKIAKVAAERSYAMGDKGCKYCDRPRRVGYLDRDAVGRAKCCSPIDMPECEELLSQAGPYSPDSELCPKCCPLREETGRPAWILFEEFGQSDGGREKLRGKLYEMLQKLRNEIGSKNEDGLPVGQMAFDECVSVVLLHRVVPENKKTQK